MRLQKKRELEKLGLLCDYIKEKDIFLIRKDGVRRGVELAAYCYTDLSDDETVDEISKRLDGYFKEWEKKQDADRT